MKNLILILLLLCGSISYAQNHFNDSLIISRGFKPHSIVKDNDTIWFYIHQKSIQKPKHLVLFLNGSEPQPLFSYEYDKSKLKSYYWGHQDYRMLSEDYAYVVIAKPGLAGAFNEADLKDMPTPSKYLAKNSLDYRVWMADKVIDYCRKNHLQKGGKVIVYGHSEGYNVVARLLTVNRKITHAGLWAGSAMPDYYDFMIMNRKEVLQETVSDSVASEHLDTLLLKYKTIFEHPAYHKPGSIYTNKRWISYARGSIEDLRQIDIPLYMIAATKDDNAPFENSYIVPLEFVRLRKTNLTWKVCVGCDHSLTLTKPNGEKVNYWSEYFKDFITWTDK